MDKLYNAKQTEEKWKKIWEKQGTYLFQRDSRKPLYSVDTPPPYVSAFHLHVGHAMSYIQAEIIVRYRRMQGYNVFYPMGFDDNGLPTERYVEKKYKLDKSKISRQEFVKLCLEETELGIKNYRQIWESLAIGVDWNLTYNTIGKLAQKIAQRSFIDLYQRGLIYREFSPTFWCTSCKTALAQADLEDKEEIAKMYYLKFLSSQGHSHPLVATTRPEMLPACVSLYVNPADTRFNGLIGKKFFTPIFGEEVEIRTHPDVAMNKGSGVMMVCTWGDADDIKKWKEHSLTTKVLLDEDGKLTSIAGLYAGKKLDQARKEIVNELESLGLISKTENIVNVKNIHERCGTPVEFLSSPQWFIKLLDIKKDLLEQGEALTWFPQFMKVRYLRWIDGLKWDWCISRDRYYGVPFPIWYCQTCGQIIMAEESALPVDPRDEFNTQMACWKCGSLEIIPEKQVMDTWMTSSLTPLINAKWREEDSLMDMIYPMDLRVQAFEIIRTWLFYTIVKSFYHTQSLPWKTVMISGWGLDTKGKKMSKSQGNFVPIEFAVDKYSADAIRWWSTGAGLGQNLRYSESDLEAGKKIVTKLWNVGRFIKSFLGNSDEQLTNFSDRWIMAELQDTINLCTIALEECDYNKARIALEKFFWSRYCDAYLELCKDRSWNPDKYERQDLDSLSFTLKYSIEVLFKLFAPILPFISEELYHLLFKVEERYSIHHSEWPKVKPELGNPKLLGLSKSLLESLNRIRHFKSTYRRKEISLLSLVTGNLLFAESVKDLAALAKAKRYSLEAKEGIKYGIEEGILYLA